MRRLLSTALALLAAVLVALGSTLALAADKDAPRDLPPATVTLHGEPIVTLRDVLYGMTPEQRADGVEGRFEAALKTGDPGVATMLETPMGALVSLDDRAVLLITPGDIRTDQGETLSEVARRATETLGKAFAEARLDLGARRRLPAIGWSILATFALVLGILGIARAEEAAEERLARLGPAQYREGARHVWHLVVSIAGWLLRLAALYLWLRFVLHAFVQTRALSRQLGGYLWSLLTPIGSAAIRHLPDLFVLVIIFLVARFVAKLLEQFFDRIYQGRIRLRWMDPDTARPTKRLVFILLWITALVMAYPYVPGSDSEAFKGIGVFVGLLVSLGASGVVGQIASGMLLVYAKTFKRGEYVRINADEGTIVDIGLLSTRMRTPRNEEINLPNATLLAATIKNYTRLHQTAEGVFVHTTVTIGYAVAWRQVHALLKRAAARTRGLRAEPAPFVLQGALSDFYVEYQLNASIERPEDRVFVLAELHENIQDEFNEHGVQIMSPHYMTDPSQPHVVPKGHWFEAPASPPK